MKPTDTAIAKYYGVSRETLRNYKNGKVEKQRLYEAMRKYFIEQNDIKNLKGNEQMISKELLSEILEIEVVGILGIDKKYDLVYKAMLDYKRECEIEPFVTKKTGAYINIYHLAHKCKEWAYKKHYCLNTYVSWLGAGALTVDIKRNERILHSINIAFDLGQKDKSIPEPEAIFKACQFILDNSNQK